MSMGRGMERRRDAGDRGTGSEDGAPQPLVVDRQLRVWRARQEMGEQMVAAAAAAVDYVVNELNDPQAEPEWEGVQLTPERERGLDLVFELKLELEQEREREEEWEREWEREREKEREWEWEWERESRGTSVRVFWQRWVPEWEQERRRERELEWEREYRPEWELKLNAPEEREGASGAGVNAGRTRSAAQFEEGAGTGAVQTGSVEGAEAQVPGTEAAAEAPERGGGDAAGESGEGGTIRPGDGEDWEVIPTRAARHSGSGQGREALLDVILRNHTTFHAQSPYLDALLVFASLFSVILAVLLIDKHQGLQEDLLLEILHRLAASLLGLNSPRRAHQTTRPAMDASSAKNSLGKGYIFGPQTPASQIHASQA
ncbi:unnamed protein product [Cyclocybe aegerita]|uniref:Uncharacterized protein n=1 Tax=Cyclocybe aegerita TaxID=1973307 RepID=A0A8S0WUG0_CYCAE|nr:unnamed protein product [Cyclocybe aegerita]